MDLVQLRMVKQILETGSLSKTAIRMNCAQSVISRQLAALEKECGGAIFNRNGRGARLTELGERILPKIDLMIATAEDLVACGAELRKEIAGEVRVAVSPQVAPNLSRLLFASLHREHPNVRLCMSEAYNQSIKADLREGRTDIAVFMRSGDMLGHDDRVICELDAHLVGLPDSPATNRETIAFSDIAGLSLILPSPPNAWRRLFEEIAANQGVTLSSVAEVNSPGPTAALLHEGAGYLISPLASGAAAARMGWIGADVHAKRLRASRIVGPSFGCKLVVTTGANPRRRVETVARLIETILCELMKPEGNEAPNPARSAAGPRVSAG